MENSASDKREFTTSPRTSPPWDGSASERLKRPMAKFATHHPRPGVQRQSLHPLRHADFYAASLHTLGTCRSLQIHKANTNSAPANQRYAAKFYQRPETQRPRDRKSSKRGESGKSNIRNSRRRKPEPPEPAPQDYQAREKIKNRSQAATTRDPMKNSARSRRAHSHRKGRRRRQGETCQHQRRPRGNSFILYMRNKEYKIAKGR